MGRLSKAFAATGVPAVVAPLLMLAVVGAAAFLHLQLLATTTTAALPTCRFPAIYNFGDSNSDTGGIAAAFYPAQPPTGDTFFHRPVGRASDGRLIIDFFAEHLELPYLSAYLDSVGTSYRHGANFATGGATIQRQNESWFLNGVSPFPLDIQLAQFMQFKARTTYLYNNNSTEESFRKERIPIPEDFSKALYIFDIGLNDLAAGFRNLNYERVERMKPSIPDIVDHLAASVRNLYYQGARKFWIHNTGPIGCLPLMLRWAVAASTLDELGCVKGKNEMALEFNRWLNETVVQLRHDLPEAVLTYVDLYAAKYELLTNAENYGFKNGRSICCGAEWGDKHVMCGARANFNGTEVLASACKEPSLAVSWDGIHFTEAANHWIAARIINGSFSNVPLNHACY